MDTINNNLTTYERQDQFLGAAIAGIAGAVKGGKKLWYAVKKPVPKKKIEEAKTVSAAGGYMTLPPEQKAKIGVPGYIGNMIQKISSATGKAATTEDIVTAPPIPATNAQLAEKLKNYLPHIGIAIVIGIVIYFIAKRK
jgi:hypothetical protein